MSGRPAAAQPLTTLDYKITGQIMEVTPAVLSVPKGIAGSVGIAITGEIPAGSYVEAFFRGPSFPARRLVGAPNAPLMLPPLNLQGDYSLDGIRLASATGETLLEGTPAAVPVKVFDEVLVSRVTSRPLTLDEIQEHGIDIDESNFRAVEFEVGFVIDGDVFPVRFPVIAPSFKQSTEIIPAAEREARLVQAEQLNSEIAETVQLPPELATVMPQMQIKGINMQYTIEEEVDLALSIPPIPALMVIPGNIGFLNQFFSVMIFTENAAPLGSGLSVHSLTAEMVLPPGQDLTAGTYETPGDDPLRFARVNGAIRNIVPVRAVGPDSKTGTNDDIDRLQPGDTGQGELLVEGLQEGLHVMELHLKAKLDGLAAGSVDVTGKAAGSVFVRNPKFSMAFTHPRTVRFNEPYDAVVTILNTSSTTANLVSVELNRNNVSGGILQGTVIGGNLQANADRVELGTIAPGETKSATFRIKSQRTGSINFSNLTTSSDSVTGRFRLRTGVDERGVALSSDSLAMPDFMKFLPSGVVNAAQRVLGQALSTNTAGQLPPGVTRVAKRLISVTTTVDDRTNRKRRSSGGTMAMALLEAAQRVRYGDPLARVLPDLLLDWQNARDFDPGWDQIMRNTDAGREWREALMLAMEQADPAPDHAVTRLVDRGRDLAGRGEAWSVAASDRGGIAISFKDANGMPVNAARSDVATAGVFHGADGEWLTVPEVPGTVTWNTTAAASPVQLSLVTIAADGTARELLWRVDNLPAGACSTFTIGSAGNELQIDDNCDGTVDRLLAASETPFTELPPAVLVVRQDPEVLTGRPKIPCIDLETTNDLNETVRIQNYANVLAILFSKPMTEDAESLPSAFRLENGNEAVFVEIQPGGRVALVTMRLPVGAIVARSMTVGAAVEDLHGNPVVVAAKPVMSRLLEGVNVRGRVIRADGSFAANVPVTLTYNDESSGPAGCDGWVRRVAQLRTDTTGAFDFDFVLGGIPYSLSVTDTSGLSASAVDLILASAVNGEVDAAKLAQLVSLQANEDSLLAAFAAGAMPEAIAKAEGLDRALINDMALPLRYGSESNYALRFRGRGTVTGTIVLADGVTRVTGAAANLFPDVNSRELGRGILTDSSGRFAFFGVPLGPFTIEAVTPTGLTRTVSGLLSSTGETVDMVVSLGPTPPTYSDWQGRLIEPDGTPVAGGPVYVGNFQQDGGPPFVVSGRATTDSDGYWTIRGIPVGSYTVLGLSLDGKRKGTRGPIGSAANVVTTANIVLQARATVTGVVRFANGDGVAEAIVGGGDALVTTDATGRFILTGVPTGHSGISAGLAADPEASDPRRRLTRIASTSVHVQPGDNAAVLTFPAMGNITGQVFDESGAPVPNEIVAVPFPKGELSYFLWVQADGQGRYEVPGLSLGTYTLSAPAPPVEMPFDGDGAAAKLASGSAEEVAAVIGEAFAAFTGINNPLLNGEGANFRPGRWGFVSDVQLIQDGETTIANIRYIGRSTISGTVKNGQGVPIGARVRLTGIGPSPTGFPTFVIRGERNSDPALGTFLFDGEAFIGNWGLQAASPFFPVVLSTFGKTDSVTPNATGIVLQFPAVQETNGSLSGQILTPDGIAVGANVQVTIEGGGDAPRVLLTDAEGRFTTGATLFSLRGETGYRVAAFDPATGGKAEGFAFVRAAQDNQITVRLLGRGNAEITVLKADGTPLAGVTVEIGGGQFPGDNATLPTDANGRVVFPNLSEGPYGASASATIGLTRVAGRAGVIVPRGGTGTATIQLSSTATVTGTFVTTDGVTPITFANVRLGSLAYAPTDANGRFSFADVPLGTYVLTAIDAVTGRGGNTTVTLSANGETRDVRIIETALGSVTGLVIHSTEDATVPNAVVSLTSDDPYALVRGFQVTTGPDGAYSIAGVPTGPFSIGAQGRLPNGSFSGEGGTVRATLPAGVMSVRVDIPFDPRANIVATVFEADGTTPAQGVSVSLSGPVGDMRDTDAQGRVTFGNLRLANYSLSSNSRTIPPNRTRERSAAVSVNLSERGATLPVTLRLLGVGRVEGVVFQGDGSTIAAGADVTGPFGEAFTVGANGAFAFDNIPAGEPVGLSARFLGLAASETFTVTSGGTTTRNLILTASGRVEGRILRADGSTIATGTQVTVSFPSRSGFQGTITKIVGADGRFALSPVPQGIWELEALDAPHGGLAFRTGNIAVNDEVDDLGDIILDEDFPTVTATSPSNSAEGVDINSDIVVTFSEPLKASSINPNGLLGVFLRPATGGPPLAAAVTQTAPHVLLVDPSSPLESETTYQIVVVDGDLVNAVGNLAHKGPRDLVDRPLHAPFTATFTTRDQRSPELLSFTPANDSVQVDTRTPLRLSFDEPIQSGAVITLTGPGGPIAGATSLGVNNLVLTFVPLVELPPNATFTATVSGVQDLAGNALENEPRSTTFATLDTLGPVIGQLRIKGGAAPASGSNVVIEAVLAAAETGVRYRLRANRVVVGTSAVDVLEVPVTLPETGTLVFDGIAIDRYGNEGPLTEFNVTVQPNQPPVITFTQLNPPTPTVLSGSVFEVRVEAADDGIVTELRAAMTGALVVPLQTTGSAPITLQGIVPADAVPGSKATVLAQATDNSGASSGEQILEVVVSDGTAPTVAITAPAANSFAGPSFAIDVSSSDNAGAHDLEVTLGGAVTGTQTRSLTTDVNTMGTSTFTFDLSAATFDGAAFTATVRATDAASNLRTVTRNFRLTDLRSPRLATVIPADGAVRQSLWQGSVAIGFDEPMDTTTLTTANFIVRDGAGTIVPAPVTPAATNATLALPQPLHSGETYTVTLLPAITDAAGNPLANTDGAALPPAGIVLTFTTAAIIGTTPVANAKIVPGQTIPVRLDYESGFGAAMVDFSFNDGTPVAASAGSTFAVANLQLPVAATTASLQIRALNGGLPALSLMPIELDVRARTADDDSDGIPNGYEADNGLNPFINDTSLDPDNDGRTNAQEFLAGTNPQDPDTDDDGLNEGQEFALGTNPLDPDTDDDGLRDDVDPFPLTPNTGPTANPDSFIVNAGEVRTITISTELLVNDTDPENQALIFVSFTQPAQGTLIKPNATTLVYTPKPGFSGGDPFTYTIRDPGNLTSTATVTVTVNPNRRPVAGNTGPGNALSFDGVNDVIVLPNDMIHSLGSLTFETWFKTSSSGVLLGYQDALYANVPSNYVPVLYVGSDGKLRGLLWDGVGNSITSAGAVNDGQWHHVALAGSPGGNALYLDGTLVDSRASAINHLSMLNNQIGIGFTPAWPAGNNSWFGFNGVIDEVRLWNRVLGGSEIAASRTNILAGNEPGLVGYWRFDEPSGVTALDSSASGKHGALGGGNAVSNPARLASDAPIGGQTAELVEDATLILGLIGSDPDGQPLTFQIAALPLHGRLFQIVGGATPQLGPEITSVITNVTDADYRVAYVPALNFNGSDAFQFTVSDGDLVSIPAPVKVYVQPINDAPVANPDAFATNQDVMLVTTSVLANDTDADGNVLSVLDFTPPATGALVSNGNGTFTYTPASGFSGDVTFTYRATDGVNASAPATVTITVVPIPTRHWVNAAGGNWSNPTNWQDGLVPDASEIAAIDLNGTYTVTLDVSVSVRGLALGAASGTQTLDMNGGTLSAQGGMVSPNGQMVLRNDSRITIAAGSALTVNGTLNWERGTLTVGGRLIVGTGAMANLTTGHAKYLDGVLENRGTVNYTGTSLFFGRDERNFDARIENAAGAVFIVDGEGDFRPNWWSTLYRIDNAGTFIKRGLGTTTDVVDMIFATTGLVKIESGSLQFNTNTSLAGTITGAAGIQFSGGTHTLAAATSFDATNLALNNVTLNIGIGAAPNLTALDLSAAVVTFAENRTLTNLSLRNSARITIAAGSALTVSGTVNWERGTLTLGGRLIVAAGGVANLTTGHAKYLDGILENRGTVNYTGSSLFFGGDERGFDSRIENAAGGVFIVDGEGDFSNNWWGFFRIDNAGTFIKRGAGTTTGILDMIFATTGLVQIESGSLQFNSDTSLAGTITGAAAIQFLAGTHTLAAGTSFDAANLALNNVTLNIGVGAAPTLTALDLSAAAVTFADNRTLTDLRLRNDSRITITAGSALTVNGTLNWERGTLALGSRLVVGVGGMANLTTGHAKYIDGVLENRGTVNYVGTSLFFGRDGAGIPARIENAAGAVFIVDGEGDIRPNWGSALYRIDNAGTFIKRGPGATTDLVDMTFATTGLVQIESGTLDMLSAFTQSGTTAILRVIGGTLTSNAGLSFAGGYLDLVSGSLTQSVTMGPGATLHAGPSKFTLTGALTLNATARLELSVAGAAGSAHDVLAVSGAASLGGTLALQLGNGFAETLNTTFPIFSFGSRSGDFTATEGLSNNLGYSFNRSFTATAIHLTVTQQGSVPAPGAESFTEFVQAAFGPRATGTGPVCALDKDPDRDGVCNLLEFAFGTDPNDFASCAKPMLGRVTVDGRDCVTLRYNRSKTAAGIAMVVECSTDLKTWHTNTATQRVTETISISPAANNPDCEVIVEAVVFPMSEFPAAFLRIRASLQQP